MNDRPVIAVLVSGSGSNLQAIIDASEKGEIPCRVGIVISNKADAYGLVRARTHGIPTEAISHKDFPNREEFDKHLVEILRKSGATLVCLAGFMRVLTPVFVRAFPNRILNIHPALLPSFPGTHGPGQALNHGVRFSGCTVHFLDEGVDTGPIVVQAVVPVYDDDTHGGNARRADPGPGTPDLSHGDSPVFPGEAQGRRKTRPDRGVPSDPGVLPSKPRRVKLLP
jgi:phosphoribosylglycinamide formyltransferase-1